MDFILKYSGAMAAEGELEFYDAARALIGFERTLALTTHLVINGEIITQAPSLKNAKILIRPPQKGSWEIAATIVAGAFALGIAPKDSPIGHLVRSAYDYVISQTLGFHVDYDKSLGQQHEEYLAENDIKATPISEEKLDSLIEKIEPAIIDIHRPIVWSESADEANIIDSYDGEVIGKTFNPDSYEYASRTIKISKPEEFSGVISSYNVNTFKGRIFIPEEERTIPFELADTVRNTSSVDYIASSLRDNAIRRGRGGVAVGFNAFRHESSAGRLKSLFVVDVWEER